MQNNARTMEHPTGRVQVQKALISHTDSVYSEERLERDWARAGGAGVARARGGGFGKGAVVTGQPKEAGLNTSDDSPPGPHSGSEEKFPRKKSTP